MKKTVLFCLILMISCNRKNNNDGLSIQGKILHFYTIALNDTLPVDKRDKAIGKSYKLTQELPIDNMSGKVLYQKNVIKISLQQYDSLEFYNKILVQQALAINDNTILARQSYLMGYYNESITHLPYEAFKYYNRSKNYFQQTKNNLWIGICLLRMGVIQQDRNDYFGSKETLTEALKYLNIAKDSVYITSAWNELATNHRKLLNFNEAIKYFEFAIEKSKSSKDILAYKNNLAATYGDAHNYNNAIQLLHEISVDSTLKRTSSQYARIMDNLIYTKWLTNKKITEREFQKPLKIRKQNNDQRGQIASYTHLGEFYSKSNTSKATSYLDSVIQLSKTLKIPRAEKDALKLLLKLKPKNINLRERYVFLQDSLYTQELKVKTQFAKYKYDDKLKQESILRLEKENTKKELEASQHRNQKILYLGSLLFITSILGLSFYGFRQRTIQLKQRNKVEKLKAIQQTEAELSRKLHDDHGGKLNQLMSLIQRDANKDLILDKTEELYNHTRDFSRTLNSVDTGSDFWKRLKETLEYTKPVDVEMVFNGGKELQWSMVGDQTKTIIYKVLQELVINMARHSKANQTVILFKYQNNELFIYYEDNGIGASKAALLRKNGLQNTEKRIQAIGGRITFDTDEGKGFRAEIQIPK